ncbi:WD40 repeat-like protein [Rhizopogon salebrosus TDB-379]|nr:WD40 repeat-like protein [Rhizopogon salebrosus TDB-379]
MASTSMQPAAAAANLTLTPVMTLKGHKGRVLGVFYTRDSKQMMSGSVDGTVRKWDQQAGKEIIGARYVCKEGIHEMAVSMDGRWVVTVCSGGPQVGFCLKAREVKTDIVKTFKGHSEITCLDISADNTLLASGAVDGTMWIWSLDTGGLRAGPFKVWFSAGAGTRLEVWDIQTQTLDAGVGNHPDGMWPRIAAPVFGTTKDRTIIAAFTFMNHFPRTIYEFHASTMETIGAPFEGHTDFIRSLALSFDGTLLASASIDHTIKLWAFKSRHLLASFDVRTMHMTLSPDSRQLAWLSGPQHNPNVEIDFTISESDNNIYICDIPPNILASVSSPAHQAQPSTVNLSARDIFDSDATTRSIARNPATSPVIRRPLTTPQQPVFLRYFRKFFPFSFLRDAVPPVGNNVPRDPLDFPATSRLHPHVTQGHPENLPKNLRRAPATSATVPITLKGGHAEPPIVDVPLTKGQLRHAAAGAPRNDEELIRDEDFDQPPPSPHLDSQQVAAAEQINARQHGSSWLCSCF